MRLPADNYLRILPELVLTAFAAAIMLVEGPARVGSRGRVAAFLALVGSIVATFSVAVQAGHPGDAFNRMFRVDDFGIFFHWVITAAAVVVVLLSMDYLPVQRLERGEFYALLLFGTAGMGFMVGSIELIMIFISLEISSISTYILAGFRRNSPRATEASIKYLLLGSFATAFFLYGIAMTYGASGSTNIYAIARSFGQPLPGTPQAALAGTAPGAGRLLLLGAALMFIGLAFKVSAAPFQVWTPDVYEGAPVPVTAFMSAGPKAAAFAVFLRIFYVAFQSSGDVWFWMIWVAAILSMCLGNVAALLQTNVKRMFAYSSIAHAGYVLVAFAAMGEMGIAAVLFYIAAYVAMNIGAFAVVSHFAGRDEKHVELADYASLGFRYPVLSACLAIFLLSLIGVPLTGGFFGKLYVFRAALDAHLVGLTVVGVLNSALAAYYYLRVIVYMYMRPAEREISAPELSGAFVAVMFTCLAAVIWLGVFPSRVIDFAAASARSLLH